MTKHKLFISYYHKDDEIYKNKFEELFGDLFINKSVQLGDFEEDLSTDYIKRLIRENKISNSSIIVVLVGNNTHCRKHVDWEIYAGLNRGAGLIALVLPDSDIYYKRKYSNNDIPKRLYDNLISEYASIYYWTENRYQMKEWIEKAYENKYKIKNLIDNSRKQMKYNRCD